MKILRASFLGVKGIRDVALDFEDREAGAPHDVVVLVGPPSAGKTRILEAIFAAKEAIAPYGEAIDGQPWIGAGFSARAAITFVLDPEEKRYAGTAHAIAEADVVFLAERTESLAFSGLRAVLERYVHGAGAGKVEYFPTTRRLAPHPPYGETNARAQKMRRTEKASTKYDFVGRFLQGLSADAEVARAFAERLAALSPTCRYAPDGRRGRYFQSREGEVVGLGELSAAEGDAVLFAATALAIDLQCSLVLVDRPDLHADPRDARRIVRGLRALGADNQLILTTSSPRFAEGAAEEGALVIGVEGA